MTNKIRVAFERHKALLQRRDGVGLVLAWVAFWASLRPSLLPRPWYLQILVSGIVMALVYGIGALLTRLFRLFMPNQSSQIGFLRGRLAVLIYGGGSILVVYQLIASAFWQYDAYRLIGSRAPALTWLTSTLFVAVGSLLFTELLIVTGVILGRLLRRLYFKVNAMRGIAALPDGIFQSLVAVCLVALFTLFANNMIFDGIGRMADAVYRGYNSSGGKGLAPPAGSLQSGGSQSFIPWDKLGYQGRKFISNGPTAAEISKVTGKPAVEPIRVYVGRQMSDSLNEQATLAVRELERTKAFDRQAIQIIITTGTGWTSPKATRPFEYLYGGDVATVAIQYSYLPSWISFLADRARVQAAASELTAHVVRAAQTSAKRPQIFLFGESLGSYGAEKVLAGQALTHNGITGSLLVGPPGINHLHDELTARRIQGSPSYAPRYPDGSVRFITGTDHIGSASPTPSLIYLQNPTDPVVKWDTSLLWSKPAWVDEEKRDGIVAPQFTWRPLITFFQVTVDMILALKVPPGAGHVYDGMTIEAWSALTGHPVSDATAHAIKSQLELLQ